MTRPSDAEVYADEFVARYGNDCGRRLVDLAAELSLSVREVDAKAFDGALIRVSGANRGRILLNRNVPESGRRLFTLAHEIAHFIIPGHGRESNTCRAADVESWDDSVRATEREANVFAASVLMPTVVCRPFVREEPSFEAVESMQVACGTSLTATLVRYVQLSSFAVAMAKTEGDRVRWYVRGPQFPGAIRRGPVHVDSFAADAIAGQIVPAQLESVPAAAWLYEDAVLDGSRILEVSRPMPRYGAVVTLLHAPDRVLKRIDEPSDDDLDPTEFTIERKHWPKKR